MPGNKRFSLCMLHFDLKSLILTFFIHFCFVSWPKKRGLAQCPPCLRYCRVCLLTLAMHIQTLQDILKVCHFACIKCFFNSVYKIQAEVQLSLFAPVPIFRKPVVKTAYIDILNFWFKQIGC